MSLIKRLREVDNFFFERSFVQDGLDYVPEKQPDGRVQLRAKRRKSTSVISPPSLGQLFYVAIENFNAVYAYPITGSPPVLFASLTGPIGVAASSQRVLVTQYETQNVNIIDAFGNITVLATIPGSGPAERYIVMAPSQAVGAGFTQGDIFVTQGTEIYKIPAVGGSSSLFATISGAASDHTGITFDKVGTFGNKMIVTSNNGKVWTVTGAGSATLLVDTGAGIEGPAVAPSDFGTYAGQILVTDETLGAIHAIDNVGTFTPDIFDWSGAEGVIVILSSFAGLSGILITSEFGAGIANVQWNGSSYDTYFFDNIPDALFEGAAFVDPDV